MLGEACCSPVTAASDGLKAEPVGESPGLFYSGRTVRACWAQLNEGFLHFTENRFVVPGRCDKVQATRILEAAMGEYLKGFSARRWMLGLGFVGAWLVCGASAGWAWLAFYWPVCLIAVGLALVVSGWRRRLWRELAGGDDADRNGR